MNELKYWGKLILTKNFSWLLFFLENIKFNWAIRRCDKVILILTPGKVGSTSVYHSLKKEFPQHLVMHLHTLTDEGMDIITKHYLEKKEKTLPHHLTRSKVVINNWGLIKNKRIKIITLFREPISREVSGFFQDIIYEMGTTKGNIDQTIKMIKKKVYEMGPRLYEEDWIQSELVNNFNFNVYSEGFNVSKGYSSYASERGELLILRTDKLNDIFPEAMNHFFQSDKRFELIHSNIGEKKYYSESYKKTRSEIKINQSTLEQATESVFFQTFFKDKISDIFENWSK